MTQTDVKALKLKFSTDQEFVQFQIQKNSASSEESWLGLNLFAPNEKTWYSLIKKENQSERIRMDLTKKSLFTI